MADVDADDRIHPCGHCEASFKRKEHLDRHLSRHTGDKSFVCVHCGKDFSRRDALRRHVGSSHHDSEADLSRPTERNRACVNCANHKKRCNGRRPCDFCAKRNLSCRVRPSRERRVSRSELLLSPHAQVDVQKSERAGNDAMLVDTAHLPSPPGFEGLLPILDLTQAPDVANNDACNDIPDPQLDPQAFDAWLWTNNNISAFNSPLGMIPDTDYSVDVEEFALQESAFALESNAAVTGVDPIAGTENSTSLGRNDLSQPPQRSHPPTVPALSSEDDNIIAAETYGQIPPVPQILSNQITELGNDLFSPAQSAGVLAVLPTFIDLYFRHFAEDMPFLHPCSIFTGQYSWILVLAIGMIGSQYTALPSSPMFTSGIRRLLEEAMLRYFPDRPSGDDQVWAQVRLLYDISLAFGGKRSLQCKQQFEKNTLISLCRALSTDASTLSRQRSLCTSTGNFDEWVKAESRIRLLHNVYRFECLQFIWFDIRPAIDLADLTDSLPCNDEMWSCDNQDSWRESITKAGSQVMTTPGFNQRLQYLYLYVEERLSLDRLRVSPLRQVLLSSLTITRDHASVFNSVSTSVHATLMSLLPEVHVTHNHAFANTASLELYEFLLLLRAVPLKTLHSISRWQATESQVTGAETAFRTWMEGRPGVARECLAHSLTVFILLRSKEQFTYYDPLCLLSAAIFVWAYGRTGGFRNFKPPSPNSEIRIIRFERRARTDSLKYWLQLGHPASVYVEGLGFLDEETSPPRVLHELRKTFQARSEWRGMCHGLVRNVQQLIDGQIPHHE